MLERAAFAAKFAEGSDTSYQDQLNITIDGREIGWVRTMHVHAEVGTLRRVELECLHPDLDLSFPAAVSVTVVTLPGYDVMAEAQADGTTRYRSVENETRRRRRMISWIVDKWNHPDRTRWYPAA